MASIAKEPLQDSRKYRSRNLYQLNTVRCSATANDVSTYRIETIDLERSMSYMRSKSGHLRRSRIRHRRIRPAQKQ
jgi:hypothetical protein